MVDIRYRVEYQWEGDDDGIILVADTPIPVPDVGSPLWLDIESPGVGPVRTLMVVEGRAFEVQRGSGFAICTIYVQVRPYAQGNTSSAGVWP